MLDEVIHSPRQGGQVRVKSVKAGVEVGFYLLEALRKGKDSVVVHKDAVSEGGQERDDEDAKQKLFFASRAR